MIQQPTSDIHGVIVPVITPVDEQECVDERAYRAVIRRCLVAGVQGIFAGGSSGMGPLLAEDQWVAAMEIALDEVGQRGVLMGGVMTTSTAGALQRIRILDKLGYGTMVVTPTFYITMTRHDEMICHYGACREATDMRMVAYNIPSCTQSNIPVETFAEMLKRGWTNVCKESSGNRQYFGSMLKLREDSAFVLLQGSEPDIEWSFHQGADGIVPVCANYEPSTLVAAYRAACRSDHQQLCKAQQRLSFIRERLLLGDKNWIAGIMYGVATLGIGTGRPIRPLQTLSSDAKKPIDSLTVTDITSSTASA